MINETKSFDSEVKITVNIFKGYKTNELCDVFEQINKYNSRLTETELLACRLFYENNIQIYDDVFKCELKKSIKKYYEDKAKDEILECFEFDLNDPNIKINAHILLLDI